MQDRGHKSCIFYSSGECIVEKYELPEIISQDLNSQDTRPGRKCVHLEIFSLEGIGNLPTEEEIKQEAQNIGRALLSSDISLLT